MVEPRCIRYNSHAVDYDSVFRTHYNPTPPSRWQGTRASACGRSEQARPTSAATPATTTATANRNRNRNRNCNRNRQTHILMLAFWQQFCQFPLHKSISPSIPILIMHV